jgi:hypothetical protein
MVFLVNYLFNLSPYHCDFSALGLGSQLVNSSGVAFSTGPILFPISKVKGWDGNVLWLKVTEDEIKTNYERNIIPDPARYHLKGYRFYSADTYPEVITIQPLYTRPVRTSSCFFGIILES